MSKILKPTIIARKTADFNHHVVTVVGGTSDYMKKPCGKCPWRKDSVGTFPGEAFGHSAHTSYDMAKERFGCHAAGTCEPMTCAGFLIRGAYHNLSYRLGRIQGLYEDVTDGGHELFESYREMAVANGLPAEDARLKLSRDDSSIA